MNRFICIHAHFYQPPRENPWLEEIEVQDSAYPYHDWNSRIAAECYAPNAVSRILDSDKRIIDIVNNYSRISFNIGPTLLEWLEKHRPQTYRSILEADRKSQEFFSGHGSAIAQVYNHMILPLANSRDKRTQILWGIEDFSHRFKRHPEGMWLAETAVDVESLDSMAELGIKFTILAPSQARRIHIMKEQGWYDVYGGKIDPRHPYVCKLPSGRSIAIFFYDGPTAQEIAFGPLLDNGENFAKKLLSLFSPDPGKVELVHIATDGETYGHHHRHGDMALSYCLYYLEQQKLATITNYGEFLEKHPPAIEVEVFESSSWSCPHGVERWKSNCGCNSGMRPGWKQEWRAPLRGALDWLRDNLIRIYEDQLASSGIKVWDIRDSYIKVILNRSEDMRNELIARFFQRQLAKEEKIKLFQLLEMQRHALLMYTSCGWFFDEISGIETVQVMLYAAQAIQLASHVSGISLEQPFIRLLERAPSNIAEYKNGAVVYQKFVQPVVLDLVRVGGHYAVSSLFTTYDKITKIYVYTVERDVHEVVEVGKHTLVIGTVTLLSDNTFEEEKISYAMAYFGDHNVVGGVSGYQGPEEFLRLQQEIKEVFLKGQISEVIRTIDTYFRGHSFSIWHLFRDEQRKIINRIFDQAYKEIEDHLRRIYEQYVTVMQVVENLGMPLPKYFSPVIGFVLNTDLRRLLEATEIQWEQLQKVVQESRRWVEELDKEALGILVSNKIASLLEKISGNPAEEETISKTINIVQLLETLNLPFDLWEAQNIYFLLIKRIQQPGQKEQFLPWYDMYRKLGNCLKVKVLP